MSQNYNKNQNNRNKQHGWKHHTKDKEQKDKEVPKHYQIQNTKEISTDELKYTDMDGAVHKAKIKLMCLKMKMEKETIKRFNFM